MKKLILSCIVALVVSGCATHVPMDWQATGGSRGDGTVKLSIQYGYSQIPQLDENQALSLATKRCAAWGYTGAEAFGGTTTVCNRFDPYLGCVDNFLTKEYQCTTDKNIEPHNAKTPQISNGSINDKTNCLKLQSDDAMIRCTEGR